MGALLLLSTSVPIEAADYGRDVLGSKDGWGAYGKGTTGGADASSDQVYTVKNRKQLVEALGETTKRTAKMIRRKSFM
ncbi:hypothetical protein AAGG52_08670 [Bacillus licheniformis]